MASVTDIEIKRELRPCIVNGKKALFHTWEHISEPMPSNCQGVISCTMGIIEDERGNIIRVNPCSIKFIDNKIQEYCFKSEEVINETHII